MTKLLRDIKVEIDSNQRFALDESTLGLGFLFFKEIFPLPKGNEEFVLSGCTAETADNSLLVTGTLSHLFPRKNLPNVAVCLFDDSGGGTKTLRHAVIKIPTPEADSAYAYLSQYSLLEFDADGNRRPFDPEVISLSEALPTTSLGDYVANIRFDSSKSMVFSTLDYTAQLEGTRSFYPAAWATDLVVDRVARGLNFCAEVTLDDGVDRALNVILEGVTRGVNTRQALIAAGDDGLTLKLTEANTSGELGIQKLKLRPKGTSVLLPLLRPLGGGIGPRVLVGGMVIIGQNLLEVTAIYNSDYPECLLLFTGFPSLKNLLEQLDFGPSFLPEPLSQMLDIKLSALTIGFELDKRYHFTPDLQSVSFISFSVTTQNEINLIEGIISLKPTLKMQILDPFNSTLRSIEGELTGEWVLNQVKFTTEVSYPDLDFYAGLQPGQENASTQGLVQRLFPGVGLPVLDFKTMEIAGNIRDKTFTATLEAKVRQENEADQPWGFKNAGLTGVSLGMEWAQGGMTRCAAGCTLKLGEKSKVNVLISAEHTVGENGLQFEGRTDLATPIPIGKVVEDIAALFGIANFGEPKSLKDFTLDALSVSFNTGTQDFEFKCNGKLKLKEKEIAGTISLVRKEGSWEFGGRILLILEGREPVSFGLHFAAKPKEDPVLSFSGEIASGLRLSEVVSKIAGQLDLPLPPPGIPEIFNAALTSLNGYLNTGDMDLILRAETLSGTTIVVAAVRTDKGKSYKDKVYAFLIDKNLHLGLSNLPLVGDKIAEAAGRIAGIQDAGIESIQAIITKGLKQDKEGRGNDVKEFNKLIDAASARFGSGVLPRLQAARQFDPLPSGLEVHLRTTYFFDNKPQEPVQFRFQEAEPDQGGSSVGHIPGAAQSPVSWLDVQRNFGPVSIKRLGISCTTGEVRFLLDASLVVSGMNMGLQGLSLAFPTTALMQFSRKDFLKNLKDSAQEMTTHLDGLSVTYESGPIAISGGLLKVKPTPPNLSYAYNGQLLMKADKWALSAFGSFAQLTNGDSSFFAFGVLNATLGGPSFFFVTGLAAGFGYNRSLTLPTLKELPEFPLIAASQTGDRTKLTADIDNYIFAASGQNWLAIGVRFTSFKVIDSFALLTFSFGNRFEMALLGLSTITMPAGAKKPIAFAQLALEVKFAPEDGVLKIAAQLTAKSYILDENCHLTGGFALYTWFKDSPNDEAKAGDFVLSIGGYHPNYKRPAGYPVVPRVTANWRVNNELTIKGGFYFALTPNAIMAGGILYANYESGRFKAWFESRVDFLLLWEPFWYEAKVKVSLGVSYTIDTWLITKTITCQVGVDLVLHGPPFGGTAVVDLYVCSFTLDFGKSDPAPNPLTWDQFKDRFLPDLMSKQLELKPGEPEEVGTKATDGYCYSRATGGLLKEIHKKTSVGTKIYTEIYWVVNPETFVIETASAIPCSEAFLVIKQKTPLDCGDPVFGITPCSVKNRNVSSDSLRSTHTIKWKKTGNGDEPVAVAWVATPVKSQLPRAVWYLAEDGPTKAPTLKTLEGERVTKPLTTGFKLTLDPKWTSLSHRTQGFRTDELGAHPVEVCMCQWSKPQIPARDLDPGRANPFSTINQGQLQSQRNRIAGVLNQQGVSVAVATDPRYLQIAANSNALLAQPVSCELGR